MSTRKLIRFKDGRTLDCRVLLRTETASIVKASGKYYLINENDVECYDNVDVQSLSGESDSVGGGDDETEGEVQ